jgi:ribosomal protein S18 acetylase RimI-like enzyme
MQAALRTGDRTERSVSTILVRNATLEDLEGYHACVASVAAERKYIALVEPPPLAGSERLMRTLLDAGYPLLVAADGDRVVGWCDVMPREPEGFRHVGGLGMGLLAEARRRGVGSRLLEEALALSSRLGLEKIELQVYASNAAARKLYGKFGFVVEGVRVRARKLDDAYDDIVHMARFLTSTPPHPAKPCGAPLE